MTIIKIISKYKIYVRSLILIKQNGKWCQRNFDIKDITDNSCRNKGVEGCSNLYTVQRPLSKSGLFPFFKMNAGHNTRKTTHL